MLVFLEVEPQSNQYRQVLLTPEQFKKISDASVHRTIEQRGNDSICEHRLSNEIYTLPDLEELPQNDTL